MDIELLRGEVLQYVVGAVIFAGTLLGASFHSRVVDAEPAESVKGFIVLNSSALFRCIWIGALLFSLLYAKGKTEFELLLAAQEFFCVVLAFSLACNAGLVLASFAKALAAMDHRSLKD